MARLRFMAVALLALALGGSSTQTGRTQSGSPYVSAGWEAPTQSTKPTAADEHTCVIYSLTDLGYDTDLGKWIAQTIPEIIEPSSWKDSGGKGSLRFYAPKNVLVIKQSAAVQTKVDGFLKDLKTSLRKGSQTTFAAGTTAPHLAIVPTQYTPPAPAPVRVSGPVPEPSGYPVPAPVKPPKHLFHFLIRYEGEGIIDDNVVRFMKGYIQSENNAAPSPRVVDPLLSPKTTEEKKEDKKAEEKKETVEPIETSNPF